MYLTLRPHLAKGDSTKMNEETEDEETLGMQEQKGWKVEWRTEVKKVIEGYVNKGDSRCLLQGGDVWEKQEFFYF